MKKIICLLMLITGATSLYSEKIYRVLSRGSVKDNATGLIWARCSLSNDDKPIYDFECKGSKKKYTWSDGVAACSKLVHDGRSDWRLPSIRELQTIIEYNHYSQAGTYSQSSEEVFPNNVSQEEFEIYTACTEIQKTNIWHDCTSVGLHYWSSTPFNSKDCHSVYPAWFVDFTLGSTSWSLVNTYDDPRVTPCNVVSAQKKLVRCVAGP